MCKCDVFREKLVVECRRNTADSGREGIMGGGARSQGMSYSSTLGHLFVFS